MKDQNIENSAQGFDLEEARRFIGAQQPPAPKHDSLAVQHYGKEKLEAHKVLIPQPVELRHWSGSYLLTTYDLWLVEIGIGSGLSLVKNQPILSQWLKEREDTSVATGGTTSSLAQLIYTAYLNHNVKVPLVTEQLLADCVERANKAIRGDQWFLHDFYQLPAILTIAHWLNPPEDYDPFSKVVNYTVHNGKELLVTAEAAKMLFDLVVVIDSLDRAIQAADPLPDRY